MGTHSKSRSIMIPEIHLKHAMEGILEVKAEVNSDILGETISQHRISLFIPCQVLQYALHHVSTEKTQTSL